MTDGFVRSLFEYFFNDPKVSKERKQALADQINKAYGPNPTPEQAKAVREWCPMGD